ncbi:hypothetical protein JQ557_30490 [Bradyrhizobium sp. U87765 SZCCT0131]|uniref:hypothetical protein n=1 Tax=unclassified Bradyrhizobium TaxID=2631580 RepID=UPI001BA93346|nr:MULTISPECIES: hypothetical protein [unclassified Bradyrhizobium]MBR1222364.1 hypothetical protein [Bradyrhizobium sp. U87765 SZCCT0131]MBR1264152.1 hypothetical protein [Bradyrhizobium sp. U87765 SZCCT0134]MBR1308065.1 hypothetical protein [Bradyrhizobium sp. U87765 SZCCT0110]MBR1320402.1 hypothetical protein [Bradyrhizobium sp. U87765 SZCCT0109]MBR1348485.1 hypothetical protein [Bradyrhizobium sp. U87765 SZCCT0048]
MKQAQHIPAAQAPAWLGAAALLGASLIAMATLTLRAAPGMDVVAVAFPPWWSPQQTFAAAADAKASIVRTTALSSLIVVRPDGRDGLRRLQAAGAWLTLNPQAISACLRTTPTDRPA